MSWIGRVRPRTYNLSIGLNGVHDGGTTGVLSPINGSLGAMSSRTVGTGTG